MSKINLPITELKPALTGLGKIITKSSTLPVLAMVLINRDQDGWITITGTDLDSFATVRLEQPVEGEPASILVPYSALQKLTKSCSVSDIIEIDRTSKDRAVLRYPIGSTMAEENVDSLPVEEFPPIPRIEGKTLSVEQSVRSAILEALECASTDETRLILNSAYIDVSQKAGHYVIGTDGKHLYSSNSFHLALADSLIIPDHKFIGWKPFADDGEWKLTVQPEKEKENGKLQISSRRWKFITRQIEGNYPNWRQVVPDSTKFSTTITLAEAKVESVIKLIPKIPCHDLVNQTIGIHVDVRKVMLRGRGPGSDKWTDLEIEGAAVKGKPVTVYLNRTLLVKALSFGLSQIQIIDGMSPMRFSNEGRQIIVMPVRVDGPAPTSAQQQPADKSQPTQEQNGKGEAETVNSLPAEKPAPAQAEQTERSTLPKTPTKTNGDHNGAKTKTTFESAIEQVEAVKTTIRAARDGCNDLLETLKQIQREHKNTDKEVQSVRSTLEKLQSVRI